MPDRARAHLAKAAWSLVRQVESWRTGRSPLLRNGPLFAVPAGEPRADGGRRVALTVDDGPDPRWTPRLLDVLDAHGVRATFFVVGANVRSHPELVRRTLAAGHALGNHTYSHIHPFAALSSRSVNEEISRTQREVFEATGHTPTLFRAPAGGWSRTVLGVARDQGLAPVDWSVDPKDWRTPPTARIVRTVLKAGPGDIVLCHDGGGDRSRSVAALDTALGQLTGRGVVFTLL